jgi:hypothetical protein
VQDGLATIAVETAVLTPVNNPQIQAQLIARTPEGRVVFDMNRGVVRSKHLTVENRVIGFAGNDSSMSATGTIDERLLEPKEIARKAGPPNVR